MFENMSEEEARAQILAQVSAYCDTFHNKEMPFEEGQRIAYASRVYDHEEMRNLVDASLDFWLTSGKWTDEFERELGAYLQVPYVSFVNSGSSANLLAFAALTAPELGGRAIRRGDEVITVAAGFPTTVAPIVNFGAVPVFVDVSIPSYNIDVSLLEGALSSKTKAVMLAHTLGKPFDIATVKTFCDAHRLWLIEDNCDALGSSYELDGKSRLTGTFGDIGTSSFYPPHHMTTGEGGAVYTRDLQLHVIIRCTSSSALCAIGGVIARARADTTTLVGVAGADNMASFLLATIINTSIRTLAITLRRPICRLPLALPRSRNFRGSSKCASATSSACMLH